MRYAMRLAAIGLIVLPLQACVYLGRHHQAQTTFMESIDHLHAAPLRVDTRNGRVEIVASDAFSEVRVEGRLRCVGRTQEEADRRLEESHVEIDRGTSRELVIRPVFAGGGRGGDGASFVVHLPDVDGVTVDTSNGAVRISGSHGSLSADTSNGSVEVRDHIGPADLDTSNGSVTVASMDGPLEVDTSNGSITVEELAGTAHLDTSNASIRLTLRPGERGPVTMDSSNGSLRLNVGSAFHGRVKMRTSNAPVNISDEAGIITSQQVRRHRAEVIIGDGPTSSLSTSNASIALAIRP